MYIHTQTHVHTDTCTYIHTHTHRHMYTHTDTCTDTHMYIHTDTHTHTHKKLQYFIVHSQSRVLHSRGSQRAQHTLLALLSLRSAIERSAPSANERSGLSSEPAQQDGPEGHTRPHHNFHSPLASRQVEISSPGLM
ncbi:unnamed protein product, partial [Staurois parvus]